MDADLDTLCTAVYVTADDLLPARPGNARRRVTDAELVTLASPRRSWAFPRTGAFSPWPGGASDTCFPAVPARPRTTSAAAPRRDDRVADRRLRRPPAPATATTWCCSTPPRSSAGARSRPCAARPWPTGPATAGAAATRASSGACACTLSAPSTARRGRPSCAGPTAPSARWRSSSFLAPCAAARSWWPTRAMPGAPSAWPWPSAAGPWCDPGASTSPVRPRPQAHPPAHRVDLLDLKDLLTLERHGARTPEGLRERIGDRLLALAACVWVIHRLGEPSPSSVPYVA